MLYCVNAIRIGNGIVSKNAYSVISRRGSVWCGNGEGNGAVEVNCLSLDKSGVSHFYGCAGGGRGIHFHCGKGRRNGARRIGNYSSSPIDRHSRVEVFIAQGNGRNRGIVVFHGERGDSYDAVSVVGDGGNNGNSSCGYSPHCAGGGVHRGFAWVGACPPHGLRRVGRKHRRGEHKTFANAHGSVGGGDDHGGRFHRHAHRNRNRSFRKTPVCGNSRNDGSTLGYAGYCAGGGVNSSYGLVGACPGHGLRRLGRKHRGGKRQTSANAHGRVGRGDEHGGR